MAEQQKGGESRRVADFMTANPKCVTERDSVRDAAEIMRNSDTGVVPVVVDGNKIIGLITDRDIVVRGIAEGKDISSTKVNELMTETVRTVRENADVREVLELMRGGQIRRLPVVNEANELVGIVSLGDIASEGREDSAVGRAVEDISEAPPNN